MISLEIVSAGMLFQLSRRASWGRSYARLSRIVIVRGRAETVGSMVKLCDQTRRGWTDRKALRRPACEQSDAGRVANFGTTADAIC